MFLIFLFLIFLVDFYCVLLAYTQVFTEGYKSYQQKWNLLTIFIRKSTF